jgi:hypothetical protein
MKNWDAPPGNAAAHYYELFPALYPKHLPDDHYIVKYDESLYPTNRDYSTFKEEARIGSGSVTLDPATFPNAATLRNNANLGRLNITNTSPKNGSGQYVQLNAFGTRSFSIYDEDGVRVSDTVSRAMARLTGRAQAFGAF